MIERKEIPLRLYVYLLVPVLVLSFYASGLFRFPDLSLSNAGECFLLILSEFWKVSYWANEKTPACLGLGFITWVLVSGYMMYRFRNFQTGKEYGNEDWADVADVARRRANPDDTKNRILSRHIRMSTEGSGAPSNNNMLVIGSAGRFKTTSTVMTNLLRGNANFIILDVKGELLYKTGLFLEHQGYTIRCLNLKDQMQSDRYNPFSYIETEVDMIKLIENIYDALTPDDALSGDPFWPEGAKMYLMSVFYYEWIMAKKEGRTGTLSNVLALIDAETMPSGSPEKDREEPKTKLSELMEQMEKEFEGPTPATKYYRKLKNGARETVRSIIIIVNAKLKLLSTQSLKRIFSGDDIHLREFATGVGGTVERPSGRKLALFLVVNDNDRSFNFICSMLYTQAMEILCRMADTDFKSRGAHLPVPLELWMDEFYAGARPHETETLMGVVRSRNISLIPILQSVAQIKALFKSEKWEIIMDNTPVMMFLGAGSGALETHKYISDLLGKMTIDTASDGKSGSHENSNYNRTGRELMTPAEVRRLSRYDCIIFAEGEYPILDRKALPWEMEEDIVPFRESQALNKSHPDGGYIHPVHVAVDPGSGRQYTLTEPYPVFREVTEIPDGARVISLTEEEFLGAPFQTRETDQEEAENIFCLAGCLEGKSTRMGSFAKALTAKIPFMSTAEKDEMLRAIAEGMAYEDILAMADLQAADMLAFRLKKKEESA